MSVAEEIESNLAAKHPVNHDAVRQHERHAPAGHDGHVLPAGTLDNIRLFALADTVEEAGCSDMELLNRLRRPGLHPRGCWAVGLILGKE
jgi:hypothetical protein